MINTIRAQWQQYQHHYASKKEFANQNAEGYGLSPATILDYLKPQMSSNDGHGEEPTTLIVSDIHFPYQNKRMVAGLMEWLEDYSPLEIFLNGDTMDCYSISRFGTEMQQSVLEDERQMTCQFLDDLQARAPQATVYWLDGNHEERLERLVQDNPGLKGLRGLSIPEMLDLHDRGIWYFPYMEPVPSAYVKNLEIVHGNRVSKHSAYSAKATKLDGGYESVAVGHVHRLGMHCHTNARGATTYAIECGGFFDIAQATYLKNPNWQNGFVTFTHDKPELVPASPSGKFSYRGKRY